MMEVLAMTYLINPPIFIPTLGKDVEVTHDGAWQYAAVIDKFWRGVLTGRRAPAVPEPALLNLSASVCSQLAWPTDDIHSRLIHTAAMCNQYKLPSPERLFKDFHLAAPVDYRQTDVFPRSPGYFIRRSTSQAAYSRELVQGQWGLIPWFTKALPLSYSTNNARSEELLAKASYKEPWLKGQRCLIPASVFWEPNWESGRNVWWSFQRPDDHAFGLAGLWNTWTDKGTGEVHESYTLLTINADTHPLMSRMHKPDPKLPLDQQDKRMVVVLEPAIWDAWLEAPVKQAEQLIGLTPPEEFLARPDPERRAGLDLPGDATSSGGQSLLNF